MSVPSNQTFVRPYFFRYLPVARSDRFAEELHYNEKLRVYTEQYSVWKETDEILSKKAREAIFKVVTYPRGWLVDEETNLAVMNDELKGDALHFLD
jgi:hypothetical protein